MKVELLSDKLLIRRLKPEEVSKGGIHLPAAAVEKSQRGRVVGVGKGKVLEDGTRLEMQVKEGDLVMFMGGALMTVRIDEEELLIMSETSIIAIIVEEQAKKTKKKTKRAKRNAK